METRKVSVYRLPERTGKEPCNPLYRLYETVPFFRVVRSVLIQRMVRVCPSFSLKNTIYRRLLGVQIGVHTAIALDVTLDMLKPEWISIGRNCVIGYQTTILTHEYLIHEYRFGPVTIGDEVMIGANSTILAGVTIGSGSVIGAGSVVSSDVPPGVFAAGVPARIIRSLTATTPE
ncbi:acyltransferase [Ferroacidibacillus organovorans]|uniref:Acetyltransferase n=1 Tax=Ferroacidibacillus organovorans TaxID=1765683 RepID=A0A853KI46_9BACL|nr:acyltransferase [Ferroacidibacillus organovorans]KYP80173.1 acetyltransferase [Ferroacidibacillus organovorans]OAG95050.1 acetyltransferase [Ferroacidibacillus organovorans]